MSSRKITHFQPHLEQNPRKKSIESHYCTQKSHTNFKHTKQNKKKIKFQSLQQKFYK